MSLVFTYDTSMETTTGQREPLRFLRQQRELTLDDIARRSGEIGRPKLDQSRLSRIERAAVPLPHHHAETLAQIYEVPVAVVQASYEESAARSAARRSA
jgi:transcriptional regulator with XRE-family HTH domain